MFKTKTQHHALSFSAPIYYAKKPYQCHLMCYCVQFFPTPLLTAPVKAIIGACLDHTNYYPIDFPASTIAPHIP